MDLPQARACSWIKYVAMLPTIHLNFKPLLFSSLGSKLHSVSTLASSVCSGVLCYIDNAASSNIGVEKKIVCQE